MIGNVNRVGNLIQFVGPEVGCVGKSLEMMPSAPKNAVTKVGTGKLDNIAFFFQGKERARLVV